MQYLPFEREAPARHRRLVQTLAHRLEPESVAGLALVIRADHGGRPPLPAQDPPGLTLLLEAAACFHVEEKGPAPLLSGRDLLARGIVPGPGMGQLLKRALKAQLQGDFNDREAALAWLESALARSP